MNRILIIEDDVDIRSALEDDLTLEGYSVTAVADGTRGLESARAGGWNLIILDLLLPGIDGLEICRLLRQERVATPVLILTAKTQEVDRVVGLEVGADDYVTKPFSRRELIARVGALLRRASPATASGNAFAWANMQVDFRKRRVTRNGEVVELSGTEFDLLQCLIRHRHEVVTRSDILQEVWGDAWDVFPRTIDSHIGHLRRKIETDPDHPIHIVNVRGVGYRFDA